jgi:tetratricopeptide (TPR) repeat protein/ubiquinone/menaquinone biosynthesis C-methylase UbiE
MASFKGFQKRNSNPDPHPKPKSKAKDKSKSNRQTRPKQKVVDPAIALQSQLTQALTLHQQGKWRDAVHLYRQVIEGAAALPKLSPQHRRLVATAYSNVGIIAGQQRQWNEAVRCYQQSITLCPDWADPYCDLGLAFHQQNRLLDAIHWYRQAIAQDECSDRAYYNLGLAYQELGQFSNALQCYQKVQTLKPERVEIHELQGLVHHRLGHIPEAIACYETAIQQNPQLVDAYCRLGQLLKQQGHISEAIAHHQSAIHIAPNNGFVWQSLADILDTVIFSAPQADLVPLLIQCFQTSGIDYQKLSEATVSLLKLQPPLNTYFKSGLSANTELDSVAPPLNLPDLDQPLLHALLQKALIADIEVEQLLTEARFYLLIEATSELDSKEIKPTFWRVAHSLAQQCFLNEYVYGMGDREVSLVHELKTVLEKRLQNLDTPLTIRDLFQLAVCACYQPLYQLPQVEGLLTHLSQYHPDSQNLILTQVQTRLDEQLIQSQIITSEISHPVSQAVRHQYESNPYPRWVALDEHTPQTFERFMRTLFPYLESVPFSAIESPEILIAGCGTGKQAIATAKRLINSQVMALDLSLASLAYAIRKAQELNCKNLEFVHGDLLDLAEIDLLVDVIECSGVLHHLEDPKQGLEILANKLRPGGWMKLGLYSQLARQSVTATRSWIQEQGFETTSEGIRTCRQAIMKLPSEAVERNITHAIDFYSLSECRDLIFHVQEHQLTLPDIQSWLEDYNLTFIGFDLKNYQTRMLYQNQFPDDPKGIHLNYWHQFECEHPSTFTGMYQFWVQKGASSGV